MAEPDPLANTLLVEASDGYAFLISFDELTTNPNILVVQNGSGKNASFDIVGPTSSKAWVRNLNKITISAAEGLSVVNSKSEDHAFNPDQWLNDMDSTQIMLPDGTEKLQGVPLWKIVEFYQRDCTYKQVILRSTESSQSYSWNEINANNDIRLFIIIEEQGLSFVLAEMSGDVLLYPVTGIEINQ